MSFMIPVNPGVICSCLILVIVSFSVSVKAKRVSGSYGIKITSLWCCAL